MGDSWWSRMPRAPLRPHGCLSWRVGRHSHPSPLKGSLLGCRKVGLNEAKPWVLSYSQRAPGQQTSQPTLTPQLLPTPEGPVTAMRELGVLRLRPEGGGHASTPSCVCTPTGSWPSRSCGERVYIAGTHRTASKHRWARNPQSPGGKPRLDF